MERRRVTKSDEDSVRAVGRDGVMFLCAVSRDAMWKGMCIADVGNEGKN